MYIIISIDRDSRQLSEGEKSKFMWCTEEYLRTSHGIQGIIHREPHN